MPRGHKGSPQESVDSILLAISRREDIDATTMAHYISRLDEEWTGGAREKVLHLLRSSDALAQSAALRVLSELATDFDMEELEDFVADPTVSDLAKMSLAPILKELGSDVVDDGIIEYLNDPAGAVRQMQMRLLELVGQNEMGIETILDDVVTMPRERRLAFINWLGSSNDPRAASLLVPLLELQSGQLVISVIEALEQLGPIAVNLSIPALNNLLTITSNRKIKQQARATVGRLTIQSLLGSEESSLLEPLQFTLPRHEARVSSLDGVGTQLIMLSWERADGLIKGVNVLFQDQYGIKDCYGVDEMDISQWNALIADLDEQGFSSFAVSFDYARAIIHEARALNKRWRKNLPIAYAIWRPLIDAGALVKRSSLPETVVAPLPVDDEVRVLARRGEELYQVKEFISWLYEPIEGIEPYITRYWAAQNIFETTPRGRKSERKNQQQQAMLAALAEEAAPILLDDKWRVLYEVRLRRQAVVFAQAQREEDALLMRAVAAALHPSSGVPLAEQSFPLMLLQLSIEQGPWRLMVESLRGNAASSFPLDFIGKDLR